jgi:hypothetical protein
MKDNGSASSPAALTKPRTREIVTTDSHCWTPGLSTLSWIDDLIRP